jgi:hypothetical protein
VQLFANPGKVGRKSNLEMQRLEAHMQHNSMLHKKSLADRLRHFAALEKGVRRKVALNGQLQGQVCTRLRLLRGSSLLFCC